MGLRRSIHIVRVSEPVGAGYVNDVGLFIYLSSER